MNKNLYNFNDDANDIRHGTVRESFGNNSDADQARRHSDIYGFYIDILDNRMAAITKSCEI